MSNIALNFFPLTSHDFIFALYRSPYVAGQKPSIDGEEAVCRRLEAHGEWRQFWTAFQDFGDSTKIECEPFDNTYATLAVLRKALVDSCEENLEPASFSVVGGFRPRVEITTERYDEGRQVVSVEPYFLHSRGKFGFLADFRFHPEEEHRGTRRALQLSLSLDRNGHPNRNRYADRYSQLSNFVKKLHPLIFPLKLSGGPKVNVDSRLEEIESEKLDIKHYVVGSGSEAKSQFMGVKQSGPLQNTPDYTRLCFLYKPEDRPLSHDLFRALRGDTFSTFPGMESMFRLPLRNDRVSGIPVSDFNYEEIERVADRVLADANGSNVVSIVLTPFSRHDDLEYNDQYWYLKHAFLSRDLPIQVVADDTVKDKNKLKWSASGIGLQVFAKAGGTPWKVRPRTERCLILGIGQAHRINNGRINRYFAYSVLTDSSGVFKEVRTLGEAQDENGYLRAFGENLRSILDEYSDQFSNFVVHATFSIRHRELEAIADALSERKSQSVGGEFVSLKFNDRNRFFGFAVDHNSLVPYESSLVSISKNEYLVWFEGLQYGQRTVSGMVANPLHVQFTYPIDGLPQHQRLAHLQDAINLSGANWRGFNAKALPVSVYYAQIIARYLKEFESRNLPAVDVNTIKPWFL